VHQGLEVTENLNQSLARQSVTPQVVAEESNLATPHESRVKMAEHVPEALLRVALDRWEFGLDSTVQQTLDLVVVGLGITQMQLVLTLQAVTVAQESS
jgi:hypothetical protein